MDKNKLIAAFSNLELKKEEYTDFNDLVTTLNALKVNSLVNYLVYQQNQYDESDMELITVIIRLMQYIYNNSDVLPPITDELYDELYAIMLNDTNENIVGADVGSHRKIVNHKYPDLRGTLDKVHFVYNRDKKNPREKRKSLEDWVNGLENYLGREISHSEEDVLIFPKFDGVSVIFECDVNGYVIRALTRGNTIKNEAMDITHIFGALRFKPIPEWRGDEFGVKTEVVMTYKNFEKFVKKYGPFKSPRSAASSVVNAKEFKADFLRYVTVVPLRMQNQRTEEVILHPDTNNFPKLVASLKMMNSLINTFDTIKQYMDSFMEIPIDGTVIYITNKKLQEELGRKDAINRYEVAYKFPADNAKSTLIDVDFSVGTLGSITPVAKIEPVVMCGNTISSVSLGSMDIFESLHLHYGDEVIIKYNIIPYMTKDSTCRPGDGEAIEAPTHCRYCGEELILSPILSCTNTDCPCRMIGKIVNYLNKMDILNISEGIVTTLFNAGILKSIEDLYFLKKRKNEVLSLGGFGDKSFERILKGIKARKKVEDYTMLGSLGINGIGRKMFKKILNIYYIDELLDICDKGDVSKLIDIKGIQSKTANAIIVGVTINEDLIDFLKRELTLIPTKGGDDREQVLFTKVRDKSFEAFLRDEKNIEIASSFNKKIKYLIVPSLDISSNKVDDAKKNNIPIITLEQAYKEFGYLG